MNGQMKGKDAGYFVGREALGCQSRFSETRMHTVSLPPCVSPLLVCRTKSPDITFRFACLHGKHAVEFFLDLANVVDPVATGPRGPGAREGRCLPLFSVFISGDDAPPRAKER